MTEEERCYEWAGCESAAPKIAELADGTKLLVDGSFVTVYRFDEDGESLTLDGEDSYGGPCYARVCANEAEALEFAEAIATSEQWTAFVKNADAIARLGGIL